MISAFSGILWSLRTELQAPEKAVDFATYLYLSGSAYFGVGFGDVTARGGLGRFISVFEGGVGFGFLAVVIGYFPVLYQAFSHREVNIALLDARAGSPSSAQELLRHYGEGRDFAAINSGLHEAEHWTAELLESHISYPGLSYFRSQHDNQSWIGSITTILDACSLAMTGIEGLPPRQAQLTFAMARHAVVDIAQILKTAPRPPEPARLPPATFRKLREELATAGILLRDDEESRIRLSQLRSMYEPYVNALSWYLVMPLPEWVPRCTTGRPAPGAARAARSTRRAQLRSTRSRTTTDSYFGSASIASAISAPGCS